MKASADSRSNLDDTKIDQLALLPNKSLVFKGWTIYGHCKGLMLGLRSTDLASQLGHLDIFLCHSVDIEESSCDRGGGIKPLSPGIYFVNVQSMAKACGCDYFQNKQTRVIHLFQTFIKSWDHYHSFITQFISQSLVRCLGCFRRLSPSIAVGDAFTQSLSELYIFMYSYIAEQSCQF